MGMKLSVEASSIGSQIMATEQAVPVTLTLTE